MDKKENKILVYKNDLKNKKNKNFNLENIIFDNSHVEKMYREKDLDTLEYRLHESKEGGYYDLDLTHMELTKLPEFSDIIYSKTKHLFLGDNKLTSLENILKFKSLETLELNNNSLTDFPILPETLTELACQYNKLTSIKSHKNLLRLDCAFNNINKIEELPKLQSLICNDNKLETLFTSNNLRKLICNNNNLKTIPDYSSLIYLNAIKNNISSINNLPNLEDLLISYNSISTLPSNLNKLKYLEIIDTNITKLIYIPSLTEVYSKLGQLTHISTKYKIKNKRVHKDKLLIFDFE